MATRRIQVALLVATLLASAPAAADLQAGNEAYFQKDFATAAREFSAAAAAGDPEGQMRLAVLHLRGEGVARDPKVAAELLQSAAAADYAPAMNLLARLYYRGLGVPEDKAQAAAWYARGAEAGDPLSQHALALLYHEGIGVGRDLARAVALSRRAAEAGLEDAQYQLGVLLSRGEGTERDLGEAYYWFYLAGTRGMLLARSAALDLESRLDQPILSAMQLKATTFEPKPAAPERR